VVASSAAIQTADQVDSHSIFTVKDFKYYITTAKPCWNAI